MSKAKKLSYLGEIEKRNQIPEKSTPSPSVYNTLQAFNKTSVTPRLGKLGQKLTEERTTFVAEAASLANDTPGFYQTEKGLSMTEHRSPS